MVTIAIVNAVHVGMMLGVEISAWSALGVVVSCSRRTGWGRRETVCTISPASPVTIASVSCPLARSSPYKTARCSARHIMSSLSMADLLKVRRLSIEFRLLLLQILFLAVLSGWKIMLCLLALLLTSRQIIIQYKIYLKQEPHLTLLDL